MQHDGRGDVTGEPVDQRPGAGVTRQRFEPIEVERAQPVGVLLEHPDREHPELVQRFGPQLAGQREHRRGVEGWVLPLDALGESTDRWQRGPGVLQGALEVGLLVQCALWRTGCSQLGIGGDRDSRHVDFTHVASAPVMT